MSAVVTTPLSHPPHGHPDHVCEAVNSAQDPQHVKRMIDETDLSRVEQKLLHPHRRKGWSQKRVTQALKQYRNFLFLAATRPENIVPSDDIDAVWHTHVLDTQRYMADCERIFGYYLHHEPAIPGQTDYKIMKSAYAFTCKLYEQTFGEPYEPRAKPKAGDCHTCNPCNKCTCCKHRCRKVEIAPSGSN